MKPDVKAALDEIERKRKIGAPVEPPSRFQKGNILGGKTDAFNEAVKEQGKMLNPAPVDPNAEIMENQSRLRKAFQARNK